MIQLHKHQKDLVEIAESKPRLGVGDDCGLGKTISMLSIINAYGGKTVVTAPKSVFRNAWERDAQHFPDIDLTTVHQEKRAERTQIILRGDWDVLVTTHDTFRIHIEDFVKCGAVRFIFDESDKIRNHASAITHAAWKMSDVVQSVYLLSATPAPNHGAEYFSQLRCLCPVEVGRSPWGFSNYFFAPKRRRIYVKGKPKEVIDGWTMRESRRQEFENLLKKWWIVRTKEQCLDLPEWNDIYINVEMPIEEAEVYAQIRDEGRLECKGGSIDRIKAGAILMKLRQATSGVVLAPGGASISIGRAKLNALSELLDQIGPREPVVIWCEFRKSIERVAAMCRERGETVECLYGETSSDAEGIVSRFQNGDTARLVCHPASAGHGVTLTRAAYAVYFEYAFSYGLHHQSRGRIHRIGQKRPCFYYYLVCSDTVDESCLKVLKRKGKDADNIREVLADALGIEVKEIKES